MDQWEQLKGLLGSSAQPICPIDVAPGEQEIARVPAQRNPGSLSEVAGDLILTNTRLIFAPLMLHGMAEAREWLCIEGSAEGLVRVNAGRPPRLMGAPTIRLTDATGTLTEIGILSGRKTPNISPANRTVRDAFLDALPEWLSAS